MKILLIDDHAVVRSGLRQILADEFPGAKFKEADSASAGLALALQASFDLVLLDVALPGRSGLDVLADLRKACPKLPVLMLSMHPEEEFAVRAIRAGAIGYLTKQSAAEELVAAVRKALAGGRYVSAALGEKLAGILAGGGGTALHEELSDRELQTLQRLAAGHSVKEIAAELSLSAKTVSTYRARVLEKLGLRTNVDLARYALEHRLTT
jgi:DNA-binding NarL/FixJ family response regulator